MHLVINLIVACSFHVQGGGYAEIVTAPEWRVLPAPSGIKITDAAAIPEVFATVYLNLYELARLRPDENVLIHGGASGIGTTAIQIAKIFGAKVYATAGSSKKCIAAKKLGAIECINYKKSNF